jgi:monoterpene epsilon-lactone hydrolase
VSVIPIDDADIFAARALRAEFARFWSTERGEPRAVYDRFTAATPIAAGTTVLNLKSDDPGPGLWVRPNDAAADAAIMFVHGGGYGLGSVSSYIGLVSQIAARTRLSVFALEYPLAPEAQLPAALDLAVATLGRLGDSHDAVAVVGDSAGGGLSLATVARAVTEGLNVAAVVAFSPWTDLSLSGASVREHAVGDPLLDPAYLRASATAYLGSASPDDPRASPLFGTTSSLPPLLIQVGSDEILLDDSRRFADAVVNSGGTVDLEVWQGMHHVFQLNVEQLISARRALDRAAEFVTTHMNASRRGGV